MGDFLPFSLGFGLSVSLGFWGWALIVVESILLIICVEVKNVAGGVFSVLVFSFLMWLASGLNIFGLIWHNPLSSLLFFAAYFSVGALWSFWKWRLFVRRSRENFDENLASYLNRLTTSLQPDNIVAYFERGGYNSTLPTELPSEYESYIKRLREIRELRHDQVNEGHKHDLARLETAARDALSKLAVVWLETVKKGNIPDDFLPDWHRLHQPESVPPKPTEEKERISSWIMFWPWSAFWYVVADLVDDFCKMIIRRFNAIYVSITSSHFKDVDPRLMK